MTVTDQVRMVAKASGREWSLKNEEVFWIGLMDWVVLSFKNKKLFLFPEHWTKFQSVRLKQANKSSRSSDRHIQRPYWPAVGLNQTSTLVISASLGWL